MRAHVHRRVLSLSARLHAGGPVRAVLREGAAPHAPHAGVGPEPERAAPVLLPPQCEAGQAADRVPARGDSYHGQCRQHRVHPDVRRDGPGREQDPGPHVQPGQGAANASARPHAHRPADFYQGHDCPRLHDHSGSEAGECGEHNTGIMHVSVCSHTPCDVRFGFGHPIRPSSGASCAAPPRRC